MSENSRDKNQSRAYPGDPEVTFELAEAHGLNAEEYGIICEQLGRTPSFTELGVYSVMWSEHASYKNSILELKKLPRDGGKLLVSAGEENAGLIDIGDKMAVAFKVESHNHPSAVEPYQGAATGVGGILRDIFTMGARPIACLNSLRFGSPSDERVRFIFDGVVRGIGDYGNCMGIPTVGGEIYFEDAYQGNPLVNAMAVGIVEHDNIMSAIAEGEGNSVIYIGASTGRDGIHGATFASVELSEESQSRKSNVQVGDPFTEKLLLEATLELSTCDALVGIQDMGAAGLTCSSSEMAAKSGTGIHLDLDKVPRREKNMTPYEVLLSESQERMLLVCEKGREEEIFDIVKKWDLEAVKVGVVSSDGNMRASQDGIEVLCIPAYVLALGGGAPVYEREVQRPEYLDEVKTIENLSEPEDLAKATLELLARPNIASKKHVFRQYDSMVRNNTKVIPGHGDAAVVRVEGTTKALGIATDCNGRFTYLNPRVGTAMAVAEACRNVACVGARPLGVTNCLNFGNPYKPRIFWTFREAIAGMGEACNVLNTPVTGGNVSFYNESPTGAVYPTPVIGVVGLADDISKTVGMNFVEEGQAIYLIGTDKVSWTASEWQVMQDGSPRGELPELDLDFELRLQDLLIDGIKKEMISAAHDLAEGGLVVTLAEMAISHQEKQIGAQLEIEDCKIVDLFGEGPSRAVVTVPVDMVDEFEELAEKMEVPAEWIGTTGGKGIGFRTLFSVSLKEMNDAYFEGLEKALEVKS